MIVQYQEMAPLTRYPRRALAAAAPLIHPTDRLSQLPDEVLAQILSFLSAREAVQTCILARTWRDIWKMTKSLLITADDNYVEDVQAFVDRLLRVRLNRLECAPLHACEIMVNPFEDDNYDEARFDGNACVNTWIRIVLECEVQMLRVNIWARKNLNAYLLLDPFASRHLARLVLIGIQLCGDLDLSGCPALEYLKVSESLLIGLDKMASSSLKRLVITSSCETTQEMLCPIQICVPRLVSLRLEASDWTPVLESMPDLVGAHVEFSTHIWNSNFDSEAAQNATKCFVLEGLAEAENLTMMAYQKSTEIFTSDLRWCPTFSKLKTLVLNDKLCEPTDCTLMCILQHAPVLEKFTFIFSDDEWSDSKFKVEVKGCLDETLKSTMISQHIKKVKVRCGMVDERVLSILNFFGKLNICFQIRVTE